MEGLVWPEKFALANAWETSPLIRATFRSNSSALLTWVKPNLVGVASLRALSLNRKAIELAIDVWSAHSHVAKSPPVHWLKQEAGDVCIYHSIVFFKVAVIVHMCLMRLASSMPCSPVEVMATSHSPFTSMLGGANV